MRCAFFALPSFVVCVASAQETDTSAHISVFTNITQNADVSHPRANLGFEAAWKNTGVQVGFGVYYPNWDEGRPTSGGSAQVTCRARLKGKLWLDAQVEFARLSYDAMGEYVATASGTTLNYFAVHTFEKQMMTASVMASLRLKSRGRLWFQPFAGLGYRQKSTTISSAPELVLAEHYGDVQPEWYRDKVGNYGVGIVRLGVLIGFRFGRRPGQQ